MALAATSYSQGAFGGQALTFDDSIHLCYIHARHPGGQIRSLKVEPFHRARIRHGVDGDGIFSAWFEAGEYSDLGRYLMHQQQGSYAAQPNDNWVMEVEKVGYSPKAVALCWRDAPDQTEQHPLPPGEYPNLWDSFVANGTQLRFVTVPKWHILTLYDDVDFKGSTIELEGPDTYDLDAYAWKWRAKGAKLKPDRCAVIGIEYDYSEAAKTPQSHSSAHATAINSLPSATDEDGDPVSKKDDAGGPVSTHVLLVSEDVTSEESWTSEVSDEESMMIGISATEGVEADEGFLGSGAKESFSLTEQTQFSGSRTSSFGSGGSRETTKHFESEIDVMLGPGQSCQATLDFQLEYVEGVIVKRTWQNLRTGATFSETQKVSGLLSADVTETVSPLQGS